MSRNTKNTNSEMVIDNVISTQPELGPSVPDGGYGWVVFMATLCSQATIPSLIVAYGIFVAHWRIQFMANSDETLPLWHDGTAYVPILFIASWTFFEPTTKMLVLQSTWPRLVSTAATCLICAGLLFLWFGLVGNIENKFLICSGILTGVGASIQISQCELLVAQYFKLKYTVLTHITQVVVSLGFIIVPIVLGRSINNVNFLTVILWYMAVILQLLVINLVFKKPLYLKSQYRFSYDPVQGNVDEEEIFSKNAKELQIKRQTSRGSDIERHPVNSEEPKASSSGISTIEERKQNWVKFPEENLADWETFDDSDEEKPQPVKKWETFGSKEDVGNVDLKTEMSEATKDIINLPTPIYMESGVNYNNTYNFDEITPAETVSPRESVFLNTVRRKSYVYDNLNLLKQPTFYKSLLTIITTKFSFFVFYGLFPSFLYEKISALNIITASNFISFISMFSLIFALVSYWINRDKNRRALWLWIFCFVGSLGYFLLIEANTESYFIVGAILIVVSISALEYVGGPLLGLTRRGEMGKQYGLICRLTGLSFIFFYLIDIKIEDCFRTMVFLHFIVGIIWLFNFIYKKLKETRRIR